MIQIRKRTWQLIYAALIGAGTTGLLLGGYLVINHGKQASDKAELIRKYDKELTLVKAKEKGSTVKGWSINRSIQAGMPIQEEALVEVELPKSAVPTNYAASRDAIVGKSAKIALEPHTIISSNLLFEAEPTSADLRNREMAFVQLPGALKENDTVDIRIQFPTGQDFILLSKKKITQLKEDTITVTLKEHEILSLSSAIVDAYLHKANIYALTYVEPGIQGEPVATYPVNQQVLNLIKRDPNIVKEAEKALSSASRTLLEQNLASMTPQEAAEFESTQAEAYAKSQEWRSLDQSGESADHPTIDHKGE